MKTGAGLSELEDRKRTSERTFDDGSKDPHAAGGRLGVLIGMDLEVGSPQRVGGVVGERSRLRVCGPGRGVPSSRACLGPSVKVDQVGVAVSRFGHVLRMRDLTEMSAKRTTM